MINMEDKSMIFTLNGEILITTKGSELCFTDFDTEDGEKVCVCVKLDRARYSSVCVRETKTDKVIVKGVCILHTFFNKAVTCRAGSFNLE